MPENLHGVSILGSQNRDFRILLERPRKIDELIVSARHQRLLREARRNLMRDLRGGGAAGHFSTSAVRQGNLNCFRTHRNLSLRLETTSLLARAKVVKAGSVFLLGHYANPTVPDQHRGERSLDMCNRPE